MNTETSSAKLIAIAVSEVNFFKTKKQTKFILQIQSFGYL